MAYNTTYTAIQKRAIFGWTLINKKYYMGTFIYLGKNPSSTGMISSMKARNRFSALLTLSPLYTGVINLTSAPSVRCRVKASQKLYIFISHIFVRTLPRMGNQ
jgi:hypothetical protein